MISEKEKLEFESLPEFIREPYSAGRESYSASSQSYRQYGSPVDDSVLEKTAELEALWPGVSHHDILQPSRKSPSFFLTLGFMAGAVVSLVGVWGYSLISGGAVANLAPGQKKIVVAGAGAAGVKGQIASEAGKGPGHPIVVGGNEVIVPAFPEYEVQSGDTLAVIALKAYKRASPRLLDEICRANGMRNANVLSLGQKLKLPEYRPQTSQLASGSASVQ